LFDTSNASCLVFSFRECIYLRQHHTLSPVIILDIIVETFYETWQVALRAFDLSAIVDPRSRVQRAHESIIGLNFPVRRPSRMAEMRINLSHFRRSETRAREREEQRP